MKVLFLNPEQYVDFENEPSNYQVRLPALNSGMISEHVDFVYQRIFRKSGARSAPEKNRGIFQVDSLLRRFFSGTFSWDPIQEKQVAFLDRGCFCSQIRGEQFF